MRLFLFLSLSFLIVSCSPKKTTYYLNNNLITITRFDKKYNGLETRFFYGDVKDMYSSNDYLVVYDQTMQGGFLALLTYKNGEVVLIQPYEQFSKVGNPPIILEDMGSKFFHKIFFDDNGNDDYIRIYNIE